MLAILDLMRYLILSLFVLLLFPTKSASQQSFIVDSTGFVSLTGKGQWKLIGRDIKDLNQLTENKDWVQIPHYGLVTMARGSAALLKLPVNIRDAGTYIFRLSDSSMDEVAFWVDSPNQEIQAVQSLNNSFSDNSKLRHPCYKINLNEGDHTLYLRTFEKEGSMYFPVSFSTEAKFYGDLIVEEIQNGILFGILSLLLVFSLFTWLYLKSNVYLFYFIHIAFTLTYLLRHIGAGYLYVWKGNGIFDDVIGYISGVGQDITLGLIMLSFLKLKKRAKKLEKWTLAYIIYLSSATIIVACIYMYDASIDLSMVLLINHLILASFPLFIIGVCIYFFIHHKDVSAIFLLLGFSFSIIIVFLVPLVPFGFLPIDTYVRLRWAIPIEGTILFIVLVIDLYQSKLDKIKIQLNLIKERTYSATRYLAGQRGERTRISNILHDSIGSKLAALRMGLSSKNILDGNLSHQLNNIRVEIRDLSHGLNPITLRRNGLVKAIEEETSRMESLIDDPIIELNIDKNINDVSPQKSEILYFSFLEILQNIIKHNQANQISIQLYEELDKISLEIEDDGIRYQPDLNSTDGLGLSNIDARLKIFDGNLEIFSNGNGMTHKISI